MAAAPFMTTALDDAALDPVDEVRGAAGLDDVAAEGGDDGAAVAVGPADVIAHPAQVVAGQLARQAVDPVADAGAGVHRLAEVLDEDLRGARGQVVGFQAVQVEGFHP